MVGVLLATLALSIVLVGGVALARDITCQVGASACKGTKKADFILGSSGANTINGLKGNDLLKGEGASDIILGSSGNDRIQDDINGTTAANGGNEQMSGGSGSDILAGMAGNDTFTDGPAPARKVLTNRNILVDFGALGVGTNDRYVFKKPFGLEVIADMRGTDSVDLTAYKFSDITQAFVVDTDENPNGKWDALLLHFKDRSRLGIVGYFDDTSSNPNSPGGPGYGRIETISLADGTLAASLNSSATVSTRGALKPLTLLGTASQEVNATNPSLKDSSEARSTGSDSDEPTVSATDGSFSMSPAGGQSPVTASTRSDAATSATDANATGHFTFTFTQVGAPCTYNGFADYGDGHTTTFTVPPGGSKTISHWFPPGDYFMSVSASGSSTDPDVTCHPGHFTFHIHVGEDSFAADTSPSTAPDPDEAMADMLINVGGQSDTNAASSEG
jgi:hypothetical protein